MVLDGMMEEDSLFSGDPVQTFGIIKCSSDIKYDSDNASNWGQLR